MSNISDFMHACKSNGADRLLVDKMIVQGSPWAIDGSSDHIDGCPQTGNGCFEFVHGFPWLPHGCRQIAMDVQEL